MDKFHELWWDLVLIVLQIVGYFLDFLVGPNILFKFRAKKNRIYIQTRNIFMAYVMVKRLQRMGSYAEWEPVK